MQEEHQPFTPEEIQEAFERQKQGIKMVGYCDFSFSIPVGCEDIPQQESANYSVVIPVIPFSPALYNRLYRIMQMYGDVSLDELQSTCLNLWNMATATGLPIDRVVSWFIDSLPYPSVQEEKILELQIQTMEFSYHNYRDKYDGFDRLESFMDRENCRYGIDIARRQHNHIHTHAWRNHVPHTKPKTSRKMLRQKKPKK